MELIGTLNVDGDLQLNKLQDDLIMMLPMTYRGYIDLLRKTYDYTQNGYGQCGTKGLMLPHTWLDPNTGFIAFVSDVGPCPSDCERKMKQSLH